VRSYLALVRADLDLWRLGVQRVANGLPNVRTEPASPHADRHVERVTKDVQRAALLYRPGARCLPQAIAIARLLRREGYPVSLVVAVRRFPFAAHAWVEYDGRVLTDRQEVRGEFAPILRNEPVRKTP
jgi:hypothetical protein